MIYKHEPDVNCSMCRESEVMLNECGVCAECMGGVSYEAWRKITGDITLPPSPPAPAPIIERHEHTTTITQSTPTLRRTLVCASLLGMASGGAATYAIHLLTGGAR